MENHKTMLQKNSLFLIPGIVAIALFFVGAGCSTTSPAQNTNNTTTTTPEKVVVKQPPGADSIDYAIDACESRGYIAVLQYVQDTKQTNTFCKFTDGYACNALAYLMGACTPTSTNRIYLATTDGVPDNLRTCTEDETPVCGEDGVTYVNSCIAALQKATITHPGICTEKEIARAAPPLPAGSSPVTTPATGSDAVSGPTPPTGTPVWTTYLFSIASNQTTGSGIPKKEACTYDGTRVFYMVESCPDCFSILYNNEGKVLCYPHNDIQNECPSFFDKDKRSANCKKI